MFQYKYKFPFLDVTSAFIRKYNWESRLSLCSVAHAEQLDADRIQFYRRHENIHQDGVGWERITIDRAAKTITAENIGMLKSGFPKVYDVQTMSPLDNSMTLCNQMIFDAQGAKTARVESFKRGVERVLKTMKFDEFAKN